MRPLDLAEVLATTDHPGTRPRVLYCTETGEGLEPAGYADAVGDVVTVLDRLDTEGADALAIQHAVAVQGEDEPRHAAVVATRTGDHAVVVAGLDGTTATSDRAPAPDDPPAVQACWRVVVHALAALDRADAIPEPTDDPHPAAYLMAAWLRPLIEAAAVDAEVLDRVTDLPSESGLVGALDLPHDLHGWDAVHAAVAAIHPQTADRLGRNGVAWEAHELLGDPGALLGAIARTGHVDLADHLFAQLTARGWARPTGRP